MAKELEPSIQKIGKYSVIDVIGSGGMGIVYRALDAALNRTVAIKMLKRSDANEAQAKQIETFFNRELLATACLQHKNIVTVYESGEHEGNPYLVMEYLEGEPVSAIITARRPMQLADKLDVLVQVCDGLQYAHDRKPQVIHRDIKPANVILLKDGTVKIVDFGIARIMGAETAVTQTGQLVGSLPYMSPEQINSLPVDSRTDIFSAGVLGYQFLTYALPFRGGDPGETFVKILREDPEPLSKYLEDVPEDLQSCISRALAKKTQDRYQSAEEFGFDLLSVQRKLKEGMTADFMQRAEAAMHRGDLERVKSYLLEIVRLDRHHERANRLLAEVRRALQGQQRTAQVIQMRSQAQVALAGQQYDEALASVEQAVQLDPQDNESLALREQIREAIAVEKDLRASLRRAESALYAGDYEEAKESLKIALQHNPEDAEARALEAIVEKELAERARRSQVQSLVDSARNGIAHRKFSQAIESLRKAEELAPSDSNVQELLQWASRGEEQEQRRKELLEITTKIDQALRAEDFSSAFTICEVALGRFPNEETLLRLRSIAERQKDVAARRSFVQDQSLAARELLGRGAFEEAIELLQSSLIRFPAEPNLEALLAQAHRQVSDRDTLQSKEAAERAAQQDKERAQRLAAEEGASSLQRALDEREPVDFLEILASNLKQKLAGMTLDEKTREICDPLLAQLETRKQAKNQALADLGELLNALPGRADAAMRTKANERLIEVKAAFPRERDIREACERVAKILDGFKDEQAKIISQLTRIADEVSRVPLGEARELLSKCLQISAKHEKDAQVGALIQQITFEVNRREKQLQARIREIGQLQNAASVAKSFETISQILQNANAIASLDADDPEIVTALAQAQAAGNERRQFIADRLSEIEEITNRSLSASNIAQAEKLLSEAQQRAAEYPDIDEIQRNIIRVSAQVRGRRVEHDLVCKELNSLSVAAADAAVAEDLETIRERASDLAHMHSNDPTIVGLCRKLDEEIQTARSKLLEAEINRQRAVFESQANQSQVDTSQIASSVRRLQDLVRLYPDSVELRSLLLKSEEFLTRSSRAKQATAARETKQEPTGAGSVSAPPAQHPSGADLSEAKSGQTLRDPALSGNPQPRTESVESDRTHFQPGVGNDELREASLQIVERQLATFIGPLAKVLVKRAAGKTKSALELYKILAASLDREDDRKAFLARRSELARGGASTTSSTLGPAPDGKVTSPQNISVPVEITPAVIESAARRLAVHVGPIAAVLARKEAKHAASLQIFYELLAEHVNPKDRKRFLKEVGAK